MPADRIAALSQAGRVTLGVRPEYVTALRVGAPGRDAGAGGARRRTSAPTGWSRARSASRVVRARVSSGAAGARRWRHRVAGVDRAAHVLLQGRQVARVKPRQPEGMAADPSGRRVRRLLGHPAADDRRQLLGAGHHLARAPRVRRHRVVQDGDARRRTARGAAAPDHVLARGAAWSRSRWGSRWRCRCRPAAGRRRRCWCCSRCRC